MAGLWLIWPEVGALLATPGRFGRSPLLLVGPRDGRARPFPMEYLSALPASLDSAVRALSGGRCWIDLSRTGRLNAAGDCVRSLPKQVAQTPVVCKTGLVIRRRHRRRWRPENPVRSAGMPIATPEKYAEMLDAAKAGSFAFPAINITSSQSLNAAIAGFAEAGSDGIVQVSTGGAEYASGPTIKHMVTGAVALAEYAHVVAKNYPVNIVLHTDHCQKEKLDTYVRPLIAISQERVDRGEDPLFQSHMWDGSAVPMEENLQIADQLLALTSEGPPDPRDRGRRGRWRRGRRRRRDQRQALHHRRGRPAHHRGARPGREGPLHHRADLRQRARRVQAGLGEAASRGAQGDPGRRRRQVRQEKPFDLVFHGGSGSTPQEISDAVDYGVVKMNVDTDTQYAFTRPVAGWMLSNYDGVLKIDGEVGNKKMYDPRAWGKAAEAGMAARVVEACENLRSAGKTIG